MKERGLEEQFGGSEELTLSRGLLVEGCLREDWSLV